MSRLNLNSILKYLNTNREENQPAIKYARIKFMKTWSSLENDGENINTVQLSRYFLREYLQHTGTIIYTSNKTQ